MVSGHPPVRAQKLRFYEDSHFKQRVVPPPSQEVSAADRPSPRSDDWSSLSPLIQSSADFISRDPRSSPESDGGGLSLNHEELAVIATAAPEQLDKSSEAVSLRDPTPGVLVAELARGGGAITGLTYFGE